MVFIMLNYLGVYAGIGLASLTVIGTGGLGFYLITKGILIDVTYAMISEFIICLLYTSPSPRDNTLSRMPSSA